jgi:hypothetical protein
MASSQRDSFALFAESLAPFAVQALNRKALNRKAREEIRKERKEKQGGKLTTDD